MYYLNDAGKAHLMNELKRLLTDKADFNLQYRLCSNQLEKNINATKPRYAVDVVSVFSKSHRIETISVTDKHYTWKVL